MNVGAQKVGKIIEKTVTNKASMADKWVHSVDIEYTHSGQNIIIGLDRKFKPHPIRSMSSKTAALQLSLGTHCLILQLLYMDHLPQSIKTFLANPNITFVGIEFHNKTAKLWNEYELLCSKKVDIRALAKIWFPISFHGKPSLRALACEVSGLECGDEEAIQV
ncbi:unnamed protein product [Camellia sinensis]